MLFIQINVMLLYDTAKYNMKKIDLFPIEFFEFNTDSIDNKKLIELLSNEPTQQHSALSSLENLHIKTEYNFLFNWIDQCLEELRQERQYDCDKLSLTSSWCNKYPAYEGSTHLPHKHSMSWYSGIYYATPGAPTLFDDPVPQRTSAAIEVIRNGWQPLEPVWAEAGKLILFPSYVPHSTVTHEEAYDRWTVAFNVLPSGKINYNSARDSIAILDVRTENS